MISPLILSVAGKVLSNSEEKLFLQYKVFGFILFARNIESIDQTMALVASLRNLYDHKIYILVDQEGGRVARVKPPVAEQLFPPASKLAENYEQDPKSTCNNVRSNYKKLMSELKKLGIDSPCAPVADLHFDHAHDVIGDRSFGANVEQVIDLTSAAIEGILECGGIPIIKHLPGHGRSTQDSHQDLPVVDASLEDLLNADFGVFKALSDKFGKKTWAMSSHIIFTALDAEKPFTLSKKAINKIRDEGFDNLLISDGGEMSALHSKDDLGKKYHALNYARIRFSLGQDLIHPGKANLLQPLLDLKLVDNQFSRLNSVEQKIVVDRVFAEINPVFARSLSSVANESLQAGCDLFLYCNGDIEHMTYICKNLAILIGASSIASKIDSVYD